MSDEMEKETAEQQENQQSADQNVEQAAENQEDTELVEEKDPVTVLEEKVAALEKENAELKDQVLRRAAEFDNYRKRMIQEKQDAFDYGNAALLKDLLESLDNFDRALEASSTATDVKSVCDGISMINKSLVSMLENKYNLSAYGAEGDIFNPDEHEAIARSEGEVDEPKLKAVYLKGYKLKDKVIRHAKVMVEMPRES